MPKQYGNHNFAGIAGLRDDVDIRTTFSPSVGTTYEYIYKGTREAVYAAAASLGALTAWQVNESQGDYTLTVASPEDPTGQLPAVEVSKFELNANHEQNDILEHPLALRLKEETIQQIRHLITFDRYNANGSVNTEWAQFLGLLGNQETAGNQEIAFILLRSLLKRHGNMSFQKSDYVFQCTRVLYEQREVDIAYDNVDCIYSFDQLKKEANAPDGYVISLNAIAKKAQPRTPVTDHYFGWLKSAPNITDAANRRVTLQISYTLAQWENWVYLKSNSPGVQVA